MELTTINSTLEIHIELFMITKIQNLNGTHNVVVGVTYTVDVVYDYKDTKFEWNSQRFQLSNYIGDGCL